MKKICTFIYITLIILSVFACTMPSELEIIGSPSLKFAVNKNLSEYFDEMYDNVLSPDADEVHVLNCTNPSFNYKTFFIHIEAFRDDDYDCDLNNADILDPGESGSISINGQNILGEIQNGYDIPGEIQDEINSAKKYFVVQNDTDLPSPSEPYTVSFNDFGDFLIGFGLTGIKSKMYFSGSDIVNVINIELYHYISETNKILISKGKDTTNTNSNNKIDIDSLDEYTDADLPPGGIEIDIADLINSREEFKLTYHFNIEANTPVDLDWLKGTQSIIVEIAVLLPMEFEATQDDAALDFSDYFKDIGDLFNTAAETEFIESMNIIIGLKPRNPFGNGIFVIKDEHHSIKSPMDNNSFSFILSQEDLEYINNTEFNPGFSIEYKKGSTLGLVNGDLIMSTISLNARIKYNMEL